MDQVTTVRTRRRRGADKAPFAAPDWPIMDQKMWPMTKIKPYPNNPREHPPEQVTMLASLMKQYGVDQPIVVDDDGVILKGHGRRLAAMEAGFLEYPVVQRFGLTEAEKIAMRIADNQVALLANWDHKLMGGEITRLRTLDFNVQLLGFGGELLQFTGEASADEEGDRGRLLELVKITIADPKTKVETGDHYLLSDRHHLLCESPISGWRAWAPLLKDDVLFCPYPGVFVPFGSKAKTHPLVMVQGDPYIAGHIVDRWIEANGKKSVRKVEP